MPRLPVVSQVNRCRNFATSTTLQDVVVRVASMQAPLGTTVTTTITGNSGDVLFFDTLPSSRKVRKGTRYQILDPDVGGVWRWDAGTGEWTVPAGADSHRLGVTTALNFHVNPTENLPTYVRRYGRFMVGDAIPSETFDELYRALNALRWVKWPASWAASAVDGVDENNTCGGGGTDSGTMDGDCVDHPESGAKAFAEGHYTCAVGGATAPYAFSISSFTQFGFGVCPTDGCHEYEIDRAYAYLQVDNIVNRQACAVDYYAFALGPGGTEVTAGCVGGTRVVFNANGDAVSYKSWSLFDSASAAVRTTDRKRLGGTGIPAGSYEDGVTCGHRVEGYSVNDQCAILRWDVTGGFVFIA